MPSRNLDRKPGPRSPAGVVRPTRLSLAALLLALIASPIPAIACFDFNVAPRALLHQAEGVYEVTAVSESTFEVDRTWRGTPYDEVRAVADVVLELCTAEDHLEAGHRYLVLVFCPQPVEVLKRSPEEPSCVDSVVCSAVIKAPFQAEVLIEALHCGTVLKREELIDELRLWQMGLALDEVHRWLVRAERCAILEDWVVDDEGAGFSLTGGATSMLLEVVSGIVRCGGGGSPAHAELRRAGIPLLIELLDSSSPSQEEIDAVEAYFLQFDVGC